MSTITQFPSGNTHYRIEFDYLARTFVVVTLVNSADPNMNSVLEAGRDYRFLNPTMIEMLVDQSGFDIVRIHRQTGTDLVVDFRNGSVLTASDLTNAELQAIHIAEEGRDQTVDLAKEYADAAGSSAGNAKDSEDEARRIAESIKEAGRIGYITRRSFEKGFNVTTWNEVLLLEEDGEYYRWDGTLPKNVPAGSTPESSGGIGLGAWVSVGDASLRTNLSSSNGAGMIGHSYDNEYPEGTIGNIINKREHIKVSDFGVSGVSNETEKLRAAHAKANDLGIPVLYDVTEVTVDAYANIAVRTSVDFNGCVIKPQFSGVPSYDSTPTYSLQGKAPENVTSKLSQAGMRKGEMALYGGMVSYSRGTFWMDTRDPLCRRSLSDVTPNHYKTTINRVTKYGGLQYPLEHDFTASPSPEAYFRPDEDFWLKVEGAHIDTSGMTSGVVFKASRSQVKFSDITVRQDDNVKMTNIRQIFYLGSGVSQIRLNNVSAEAMSCYNSTSGTYLLGSDYAAEIILDNVNAVQGWGALGLHKARDLTVTNSTLNRIDGHYHLFDIDVNHTKLHEYGVHIGVGGGYLRVTNCTKYLGSQTDLTGTSGKDIAKTRRSVVYMRDDYGSYFDGDITVENVVYKMARELSFPSASEEWPGILSCVSFNAGVSTTSSTTPDYGYTAPVPWGTTVTVKNITVEVSRDSILDSWLTFVAVNYNGNYILPSVLMPASITVKDIKYSKPPRTAKISPVILPDLRGTTAAVASDNNRAFFNSIINIENIHSGFAEGRQIGALNTGVQTLMCMYTQTEISNFPTPSVVPEINVRNFYGFSGRFDIPGRLSLTDCFIIALTDSSGGRNSDSFIKVSGGFVYALPNTSGGSSSQLPRAEWNSVRFIKSPVSPDLTGYDSCIGCTFENGSSPVGITAALAFTGSVGDSSNRLQ